METLEVQKLCGSLDAVYGGAIWRHVVENRGREWIDIMADAITGLAPKSLAPVDMVLFCPACGIQHIDSAEESVDAAIMGGELFWDNPPHRSHLCHGCGHTWRPADVPTNGVTAVKTRGESDSPIVKFVETAAAQAIAAVDVPAKAWVWGVFDGDVAVGRFKTREDADRGLLFIQSTKGPGAPHDYEIRPLAASTAKAPSFVEGEDFPLPGAEMPARVCPSIWAASAPWVRGEAAPEQVEPFPAEIYVLPRAPDHEGLRLSAVVNGPGPHGFIDPRAPKRMAVRYVLAATQAPAGRKS